ncbi:MAG: hypothetical protein WBE76_18245, partial [Terracidiphilus sp.]
MANVLNPEPESITLNTEMETLDPATELEQPPYESPSNPEAANAADEYPTLDADAQTEPLAEAAPRVEADEEAAPAAATEVAAEQPAASADISTAAPVAVT